jgi:amidophosphoribosyltransferase
MPHELVAGEVHEECGVFGVFGHEHAVELTELALYALQHRGQESAGIASADGSRMYHHRGLGLVSEVFPGSGSAGLKGKAVIGHVRYSTTGEPTLANAQPLTFNFRKGNLALAHNGNLVNAYQLHALLEHQGSIFQSTSDTEVIAHLIARSGYPDIVENVRESLSLIKGAYALVILTDTKLVAIRDPHGIRPLSLGEIDGAYVVASETCAFDTIGARFIRDVEPGEIVVLDADGIRSERLAEMGRSSLCTFEYIYFARPDSEMQGLNIHTARKRLGKALALEHPVKADLVVGVPDSSISAAIGFAEESGIPYEVGLVKNKYIGRTFIEPNQRLRERGIKLKLSAVRKVVADKSVVLIDDSIVRGTTSNRIVALLREAGAAEVHLRISSPPVAYPCFYGIDISSRDELIATGRSVDDIKEFIGADSLGFLSEKAMLRTLGGSDGSHNGFCAACFSGSYPTEIYAENGKYSLER